MKAVRLACFFVLSPLALRGQGFYWNSSSASSVGMGGIYVPSSIGALDALATNPAGLSRLRRPVLNVMATAAFARGSFSNSVNAEAPLRTPPGVIPFGAFGLPVGKTRFTLGIAETPELTSVADWDYTDAPGTAGASYGYQRNKSAILVTRSAVGGSVAMGRRASIGATVGFDYNSNTLHSPYIFQSQPVVKGLKTLLDLHTAGYGVNGSVGLLFRPSSRIEVGAAWKSRTRINSTGTATGNLGAQFAALGLAARPDFAYRAEVPNILPQTVTANAVWQARPRTTIALQGEWIQWKPAFRTLNVHLSQGNNADINGLLGSASLNDSVPLNWRDQFPVRIGVERAFGESAVARMGFAHTNNAVPASTLMPLTAAIFTNQIPAGGGWHLRRTIFDAAYAFTPDASGRVGKSALQAGEYSNSRVTVGLQTVTLSTSFVF